MKIGDRVCHVLAPSKDPVRGIVIGINTRPTGNLYGVQWVGHDGTPGDIDWHHDFELEPSWMNSKESEQ